MKHEICLSLTVGFRCVRLVDVLAADRYWVRDPLNHV